MNIIIDPEFKALIPPLTPEERAQLERNIIADGCRDPLVLWDNILIDGHNRYEICSHNNIKFEITKIDLKDRDAAKLWIVHNQIGRRNLTGFQRAELALIAEPILERMAKERQALGGKEKVCQNSDKAPIDRKKELAKLANTSHDTIHKVRAIKKRASEEVQAKLRTGELSINQAFQDIKREDVRKERVDKIKEISQANTELKTDKKYSVILCDPPWEYEHSVSSNRDIENHYPTMKLQDITELPVENLSASDAVLFLWATSPKLQEAIHIMGAWGFEYRTCMVWVKDKIGMGYYARQRHELLLIGAKGEMPCPEAANRPDSVIESPRRKHSEKPKIVHSIIDKMYPEFEKIELFSRGTTHKGWESWGNQS